MSTPLSISTRLSTTPGRKQWARVTLGSLLVLVLILIGLMFSLALGAVDIPLEKIFDIVMQTRTCPACHIFDCWVVWTEYNMYMISEHF